MEACGYRYQIAKLTGTCPTRTFRLYLYGLASNVSLQVLFQKGLFRFLIDPLPIAGNHRRATLV